MKVKHECDCCNRKATHIVKDQFYKYLCDVCFEQWKEDNDDSWDDEF